MRIRPSLAMAACVAFLSACHPASPDSTAAEAGLEFRDAWARATPAATPGAAYFTLLNHGSEPDSLLAAASPVAAAVQIHQSLTEGGMARMRPAGELVIPAGGRLDFAPGGWHVMFTDLSRPLVPGDQVPLTLTFRRAGAVTVTLQVRDIAGSTHLHAGR